MDTLGRKSIGVRIREETEMIEGEVVEVRLDSRQSVLSCCSALTVLFSSRYRSTGPPLGQEPRWGN